MLVVVVYDIPDNKREKRPNLRQSIMLSRFEGNFQFFIYTPRQIAETLYFSLRCVDGLQGEGLRYVLESILGRMC
jgi:hypothetical protein